MYLIATIGPRSCDNKTIDKIIKGGANTIRINLSHGIYEEIDKVIGYIRKNYHDINLLMDLQGHKIRVSDELKEPFYAKKKSVIYFCSEDSYSELCTNNLKNKNLIPLNISTERLKSADFKYIYMKDGTMKFNVINSDKNYIKTIVNQEGMVRAEKGCNLPGISRDDLDITEKDKRDIQFALDEKVDILCYSYCSSLEDCNKFKEQVFKTLRRGDKIPKLFAKIETKEAVINIKDIADNLDGVVIARGDLVPESTLYAIPIIQDKIVYNLKERNKDIIIATHVFDSMKKDLYPTVNELSDIYNMVKKNVSGFMLTSETTVGNNHFEVVRTLKMTLDYYKKVNNKIKKNN